MEINQQKNAFLALFQEMNSQNKFIKLSLSKVHNVQHGLKNVYIVPVLIKGQTMLSFTYRSKTQDQVKNYPLEESVGLIAELLGTSFLQALLISDTNECQLLISKKGVYKLIQNAKLTSVKPLAHNKEKKYFISNKDNTYLQKLGVCDSKGRVKDKQQDKYRQINKYVELMSSWFEKIDHSKELKIVDMGSGKGYLTFALYDYLHNQLKLNVSITGVELRKDLVDLCNSIRTDCGFEKLHFISKDINDFSSSEIDVIIALHACDTATDLAIYKGVKANAELIVCAPCCHKQVRKDMGSDSAFNAITKHGIFHERQAEMLTDAIRSLLMEREGYSTKAFEFISNEHTRKNVMLVGRKLTSNEDVKKINLEIKNLKDSFKINRQELEDLLAQK
tara:strand:+ start:799 stop:1971 length:1173 start_codon:yes stop_codon:yes gene_type:complete